MTAEPIGCALADACGAGNVRRGEASDAVGGLVPGFVAAPADLDALAALLAAATREDVTVLPRGAGSKLHWGPRPRRLDVLVDMSALGGIVAHYVDDLVVTVGAGSRVIEVQRSLAATGQRLAIDPGSAEATIGGMLAAAETGPLRMRHGAPKDLLLGVEFVRADGTVTHSGGRVVKNVAGYDLGKLLAGSWGTLGVIATATMRLQPIPAARTWVSRRVHSPLEVRDLVRAVLASGVDAAAIEMDLPSVGAGTLSVLLEGSVTGVDARWRELRRLIGSDGEAAPEAPAWWGRYPFDRDDVAVKIAAPVDDLHAAVYAMRDAVGTAPPVRGSAGSGVCYAALPAARAAIAVDAVRTNLIAHGGNCVVLYAPDGVDLDMWGRIDGLDLMRSVKARFDPAGIFAPGRFAGGI